MEGKIWGTSEWGVRRKARRARCKLIPSAFLSVDWPYKLLPGSNGLITACYQRQRGNWTLYLVIWYCSDTGAGQHTWQRRLTHTHTHRSCKPHSHLHHSMSLPKHILYIILNETVHTTHMHYSLPLDPRGFSGTYSVSLQINPAVVSGAHADPPDFYASTDITEFWNRYKNYIFFTRDMCTIKP